MEGNKEMDVCDAKKRREKGEKLRNGERREKMSDQLGGREMREMREEKKGGIDRIPLTCAFEPKMWWRPGSGCDILKILFEFV